MQYTQKVWYLPDGINQSPTNHSIAAETLRRFLQIAQEAKQKVLLQQNLAITKIAMQIQKEESPVNHNIVMALGSFHIEMTYFQALGKIISESGGPFLLQECQVSIKSFLSGLSYNYSKCKQLHEIKCKKERIAKQKIQTLDPMGKFLQPSFVHDLFGSLLCLSLDEKIDMTQVLSYPLTPVPRLWQYVKLTKNNFNKSLRNFAVSETPEVLYEPSLMQCFLRLHVNLPNTFEAVARYILERIVNCEGDTIHFVCDKRIEPSIKDCEREDRVTLRGIYSIKGPAQIKPSDWGEALKNKSFKEV